MTYSIKANPDGSKVLQKDGKDQYCPFQPAQMVQVPTNQMLAVGQPKMQVMRMRDNCGDHCPLFNLVDTDLAVTLHCGHEREIILAEIKAQA